MAKHHYEIVKETFTVLEFYRDTYASGQQYQDEFKKILGLVRLKAENYAKTNSRAKEFLLDFANSLEKENSNK